MTTQPLEGGSPVDAVELGGLAVARIGSEELLDRVFGALARRRGGWIVTANLDIVQRAERDPDRRALYSEADWIVPDGTPLLWAARLRGRPFPERLAGSDLVWSLAARAAREGRSLYLLGGEGDAAAKAGAALARFAPGLRVVGSASPRLSSPPGEAELRALRDTLVPLAPDLLFVGLGSPKQEEVIRALRPALPGCWMMGCGISLGFLAGDVPRAPRWMQRLGLEWLHRLAQEPRRLAHRYLVQNLPFSVRLLARSLRARAR